MISTARRRDRPQGFTSDRSGIENTVLHVSGLGLVMLVPGMLFAFAIEWGSTSSDDEGALLLSAAVTAVVGLALWRGTRPRAAPRHAAVFGAVAWTWVFCSLAGALPYYLGSMFGAGEWDSALFESVSGFSATGSTVLTDIEAHGRGVLMWRQLTQWYGGMGMVVLAVTVLPLLGVGGLSLISAEAPGPAADQLAPRVSETAKRLWTLYAGLTVLVAVALYITPGPSLYDSVAHAVTTTSTGGFSPYNVSIGHYDSLAVELIIAFGLAFCAVNFTLHYRALQGDVGAYARSGDFRIFAYLIGGSIAVTTLMNWENGLVGFGSSLRHAVFNVVTLASSGGFGNATDSESAGNFVLWAPGAQVILLALMVIGGSVGSTAGGLKVFRFQVVTAHMVRQLKKMRHPRAVIPVKLGRDAIDDQVVHRVIGFVAIFAMVLTIGTVALTLTGADLISSSSAIISAMSNMGPALGEVGPTDNFTYFTRPGRGILMAAMLVGRLEIFAMLLMFAAAGESLRRRRSRRMRKARL